MRPLLSRASGRRHFGFPATRSSSDGEATLELDLRSATVRVGFWLGWASILAVLAGLAFGVDVRHRLLLLAFTFGAAAANTAAMSVPWQDWLAARRGRLLLDLWCGGLIAFVALLVLAGGSTFALLLFLVIPFIAVVQSGWRRAFWLTVSAGTCVATASLIPLSAGPTAMLPAVRHLLATLKRMSVVFIVSDFITDEDLFGSRELAMLAATHDVIAVVPGDPTEAALPAGRGYVQLRDLESGRHVAVNLSQRTRRAYAGEMRERREALARALYRLQIDPVFVPTDGSPVEPLLELFARRLAR